MEPFADIHCHILPGLDDGPQSWDDALTMARIAHEDGISTMLATPHQLGAFAHNRGARIRGYARELQDYLAGQRVGMRVLAGAEVRVGADLVAGLENGDTVTLADQRKHVLLEIPHDGLAPLGDWVAALHRSGLTAVLAHPERHPGLLAEPALSADLVRAGCLLQLNADSLLGGHGARCRTLAADLIRSGLAHFIATDAHGTKARRPLLRRAFECAAELAGDEAAIRLCSVNPLLVAAGHDVPIDMPRARRGTWTWLLNWRRAG